MCVGAFVVAGVEVELHLPVVLGKELDRTELHTFFLLLNRFLLYLVNIAQGDREVVIEVRREGLDLSWGALWKNRHLEHELVVGHDQVALDHRNLHRGRQLASDLIQTHQLLLTLFYFVWGQTLDDFLRIPLLSNTFSAAFDNRFNPDDLFKVPHLFLALHLRVNLFFPL